MRVPPFVQADRPDRVVVKVVAVVQPSARRNQAESFLRRFMSGLHQAGNCLACQPIAFQ